MFIELIELLRCTGRHEESWLVASIDRADGRVVLEGRLGCHVCGAQFPVSAGAAEFGSPPPVNESAGRDAQPEALRVAALLGLEPSTSGVVVLEGVAAAAADLLLEMLPVSVIALNPLHPMLPRERFGVVTATAGIPLRAGVAAGMALGSGLGAIADAVRVLRPAGRLLAPVTLEVPVELDELARDAREWVAEKSRGGGTIQLRRG